MFYKINMAAPLLFTPFLTHENGQLLYDEGGVPTMHHHVQMVDGIPRRDEHGRYFLLPGNVRNDPARRWFLPHQEHEMRGTRKRKSRKRLSKKRKSTKKRRTSLSKK